MVTRTVKQAPSVSSAIFAATGKLSREQSFKNHSFTFG